MRIVMYSHWYDPEGGAAAHPGTVARQLVTEGNEVAVVTGYPIYPSGRVAQGYRIRPYSREVLDDVVVHRGAAYPSHDDRASRRMLNYLSYAASGSIVGPLTVNRADVALVYSSPATAAIPALVTRALRRLPYVLLIQDLWPQTVLSSDFASSRATARMEAVLHRFCDTTYRRAHSIAVTSPGMVDQIAQRGIPRDKIHYLPNWAEERFFHPAKRDEKFAESLGLGPGFRVMYAGNLGDMQNLDIVIEAADRLRDKPGLEFVFVGGGVREQQLRDLAAAKELTNITFVPPQPFERMADVLALGDVQLISLKDSPLFRSTLPSKLQATLACGRPIVGAVAGDAADVIGASGAGVAVTPGDSEALARAIADLSEQSPDALEVLAANARAYYEATFAQARIGAELTALLATAARS